jgi:hypothetical protein
MKLLAPREFLRQFNERLALSDEAFVSTFPPNAGISVSVVNHYRRALGELYKSPPDRFHPTDTFDDLSALPQTWSFDVIRLVIAIEDALGTSLPESELGHITGMSGISVGEWLVKVVAVAKTNH